jgi:hypothetical protein
VAELKSLADLPDDAIDTSDAPELLDWSGAKRGLFYRPVKQQLTLRLDADVVAWFKEHTTAGEAIKHVSIGRCANTYTDRKEGPGDPAGCDIIPPGMRTRCGVRRSSRKKWV